MRGEDWEQEELRSTKHPAEQHHGPPAKRTKGSRRKPRPRPEVSSHTEVMMVPLAPPPSEDAYEFAMHSDEGVFDLYDDAASLVSR